MLAEIQGVILAMERLGIKPVFAILTPAQRGRLRQEVPRLPDCGVLVIEGQAPGRYPLPRMFGRDADGYWWELGVEDEW